VFVADLRPGTWQLQQDSRVVASAEVSPEAASAYFPHVPAGDYVLRRKTSDKTTHTN
jgi:hypothetical protein